MPERASGGNSAVSSAEGGAPWGPYWMTKRRSTPLCSLAGSRQPNVIDVGFESKGWNFCSCPGGASAVVKVADLALDVVSSVAGVPARTCTVKV